MFCSYVFEKHDLKTTQNTIRGGRVHFCAFFGATFLQTAVCIPVLAGHPAQGAANSLFLLLLFWKYFLFFSSTKLLYKTLHTHVTYYYTNIKKKTEYLRKFLILTYPFLFWKWRFPNVWGESTGLLGKYQTLQIPILEFFLFFRFTVYEQEFRFRPEAGRNVRLFDM